jgi:hypothetical protein
MVLIFSLLFFMVVPALLAIATKCEQEQCMADQDQKKLLVLERTKKKACLVISGVETKLMGWVLEHLQPFEGPGPKSGDISARIGCKTGMGGRFFPVVTPAFADIVSK